MIWSWRSRWSRGTGPVLEVVVREEADVRHEDARIDVDAVQHVEVVAAVGLADVAERRLQIELTTVGAEVIARYQRGAAAELHHQASA